jgi:predicted secreted protein
MDYNTYPVSILERRIENGRIQMKYPEIQGLTNQELQIKINEKIKDTVYKTIWNHGFDKDPELFVTGDTQITLNRAGIVSMVLRMNFGERGSRDSFLKVKALTLNLQNGTLYKFPDLFKNDQDYLSRLNKIIRRLIVEKDIPLLKKFKTVDRDQKFYLTADSLVVFFPRSEFTPDHLGILEFTIPFADLRDLAYEKGPLIFMEAPKLSIGENANGKTIHLVMGQSLELTLAANPSTGYTWQAVQKPNPDILRETRHYLLPQGKNPGSPALEYWVYSPVGAGATSIVLEYNRSWTKAPPVLTFQVNILVS